MASKPSRQLGAILRAVPPATATAVAGGASLPPDPISEPPRLNGPKVLDAEAQRQEVAKPVDAEVPLQVTVPKRIRKELMMMAAEQDCSVRALVLRAVTSLGIEVAENEMRDKRRKP